MKPRTHPDGQVVPVLTTIVSLIILVLPFHALFTTWLGANFGYLDLFRVWKELLMLILGGVVLILISRRPALRGRVLKDWLIRLIGLYCLWFILFGFFALISNRVNAEALVFSWIVNLRFVIFFVLVGSVAAYSQNLKHVWPQLLLWPATLVVGFGLLQWTLLPIDFLSHFGYGPETIPAVHTIDQKIEFQRIQSSLRGANPLGAYLLLIITLLVAMIHRSHKKIWLYGGLAAAVLAIFLTYSRSAWVGTALSTSLLIYWLMTNRRTRQWATVSLVGVVLLAGVSLLVLRNNDTVQNTLFHTDENSRSIDSSNEDRREALASGLADVGNEPLGRGPGTAGPASVRNTEPARIAENYFLQIAQEVGLIGLGLFIAINALVARYLWQERRNWLALSLLAALAGLTLVNMFLHAWTDDTISLIWWGSAGLVWGGGILKTAKANEETKIKTKKKARTAKNR